MFGAIGDVDVALPDPDANGCFGSESPADDCVRQKRTVAAQLRRYCSADFFNRSIIEVPESCTVADALLGAVMIGRLSLWSPPQTKIGVATVVGKLRNNTFVLHNKMPRSERVVQIVVFQDLRRQSFERDR